MPKRKRGEAVSLLKSEQQKLQRLHPQGAAEYGSVCNLAKASNLPVSKVREFLHSMFSYEKILATRKFMRMKAYATIKNETWLMNLTFVVKLAKKNVKTCLIEQ